MTCLDPQVLSAYMDKEATPIEEASVVDHLQSCRACHTRLESMKAARSALKTFSVPAMPPDLAVRLAAMQPMPPVRSSAWAVFLGGVTARSSMVTLALAACLAVAFWVKQSGMLVERVDLPADLLTAAHNQYALTMPLAPAEKILSDMPVRLAGGLLMDGERDVY